MIYLAHVSLDGRKQTVKEHCQNVANLCKQKASTLECGNIVYLIGLLHDVGKLCSEFKNYLVGESNKRRGDIDHSYAGAKYILENAPNTCKAVARLIARVILSHHGLHDWITEDLADYLTVRTSKDINYAEIKAHVSEIIDTNQLISLLQQAQFEYATIRTKIKHLTEQTKSKNDRVTFAFYLGLLDRYFESVLIDADRTDTHDFMYDCETIEQGSMQPVWSSMKASIQKVLNEFRQSDTVINKQRQSISDRCAEFANHDVHICRLIVPTGGGKTLASMRFAVDYCNRHPEYAHIFYSAPFMSILEQNSAVFREITGSDHFTEHHSNVLIEASDNPDELAVYELHTERWDNAVIATTQVQMLNTLFKGKLSSVRRFHQLANSVIILDEIQSLPLQCTHMFNLTMNFISYICNSVVVLCTATQPDVSELAYPIVVDTNDSMTGDYSTDFEIFQRNRIIPVIDNYGYSFVETAEFCYSKFQMYNSVLLIVNTKKAALKIYQQIKAMVSADVTVLHLSTGMCAKHRLTVIEQLRQLLAENKPVICITTQLIEAGVDISFKCVIRSLAGLDNAVQAAGRCNRHGDYGKNCPVYIIRIKDESLKCLPTIQTTQKVTTSVCSVITDTAAVNLADPKWISAYYKLLYRQQHSKLDYPISVDNITDTLLNLLALNINRVNYASTLNHVQINSSYGNQAFASAGMLFKAIEDDTIAVVVPYSEQAEMLIEQLENFTSKSVTLLRELQPYTVNVYENALRRLKEIDAVYETTDGVIVLKSEYYNAEYGITTQAVEPDLLIF